MGRRDLKDSNMRSCYYNYERHPSRETSPQPQPQSTNQPKPGPSTEVSPPPDPVKTMFDSVMASMAELQRQTKLEKEKVESENSGLKSQVETLQKEVEVERQVNKKLKDDHADEIRKTGKTHDDLVATLRQEIVGLNEKNKTANELLARTRLSMNEQVKALQEKNAELERRTKEIGELTAEKEALQKNNEDLKLCLEERLKFSQELAKELEQTTQSWSRLKKLEEESLKFMKNNINSDQVPSGSPGPNQPNGAKKRRASDILPTPSRSNRVDLNQPSTSASEQSPARAQTQVRSHSENIPGARTTESLQPAEGAGIQIKQEPV